MFKVWEYGTTNYKKIEADTVEEAIKKYVNPVKSYLYHWYLIKVSKNAFVETRTGKEYRWRKINK